jgi:ubiquitin carboxyl-terminal hydrolase 22/27/51
MSVILQSLIHNPIIRTFYLTEGHKKEDCEREACTSCALDDIFNDFFGQEKHEGYGAVQMLQGCWKGGGGLAGYSQQDAHEYLGFILNSLHSANTAEDDDSQGSIAQPKDAADRDCTCVVHKTFGGLLKSTVTCSKCKTTTTAHDPFMDLSLDIRNSATANKKNKLKLVNGTSTSKEILPMDLTECLDRFTSAETLSAEGGNYHCRTCDSAQEAKKKLSLVQLPPVVPIHLKRFRHEKTLATSSKVETKIRFPLTLDLTPYSTSSSSKSKANAPMPNGAPAAVNNSDAKPNGDADEDDWVPPDPVYELSSVVVHKGKIDNGHYVSYSRQGEDWFRFDDSMVVQVDEKEAMGVEAYMLFYVIRDLEG